MSVQKAKSPWSPWRWGLFLAFLVLAFAWAKVLSLEEHVYLAPFLSIATLVTAFAVWASRDAGGEKEAIDRARQGLLPRDGEKGVAIGTIHPLTDEVPEAPFSGRKAVAYIYRVYRRERTSSTSKGGSIEYEVAAYVGRAAALSEVRTAAGPVRVLGMPLLEVEKEVLSGVGGARPGPGLPLPHALRGEGARDRAGRHRGRPVHPGVRPRERPACARTSATPRSRTSRTGSSRRPSSRPGRRSPPSGGTRRDSAPSPAHRRGPPNLSPLQTSCSARAGSRPPRRLNDGTPAARSSSESSRSRSSSRRSPRSADGRGAGNAGGSPP